MVKYTKKVIFINLIEEKMLNWKYLLYFLKAAFEKICSGIS